MRTLRAPLQIRRFKVAAILMPLMLLCAGVTAAQTYSPLYTYSINAGSYSGILPAGFVAQGRDGLLYSTIANNGTLSRGTTFQMTLAGTPTTLYNFCSQPNCTDGAYPQGGLTLSSDGNLYGTTNSGGTKNSGTVFKMTPAGAVTTLYSFTAGAVVDVLPLGRD